MSDIVDFVLKLNDQMSGGIQKVATNTRVAFEGIDRVVAGTQRHLSDLGGTVKLNVDINSLSNAAKEAERLKKSMNDISEIGSRGGGGMGGMAGGVFMGGLAAQGTMMAARKAFEMGRGGLDVGMDMEKNIVGLSTFVGEQKARAIIDRIVKEGVYTPYTTQQLLPIERGLIVNENPEKAHRDTWALANAVAATGGGAFELQRMGWHMQQGAANGIIDGRILREFGVAGIPIKRLLENSMPELKGLSNAKAMDKLDGMTIKYDMVADALYQASLKGGMFGGAMEKLSQTVAGKWSTVMDKMQIAGWKLTEGQSENIKHLEDRMMGFADDLPAMAAKMAGDLNKVFQRFDEVLPSFSNFGGALMKELSPIKDLALSKGITDFSKSILDISAVIAQQTTPAIKDLAKWAEFTIGGASKELNYYKSGLDLAGRVRPFNRTEETEGSGLVRMANTIKHLKDDLSTLTFGLIKPGIEGVAKANKGLGADYVSGHTGMGGFGAQGSGATPAKSGGSSDSGLSEAGDAIVGGGRRNIIINVKSFAEHFSINNDIKNASNGINWKQQGNEATDWFKRVFLEVLQSAAAAQ